MTNKVMKRLRDEYEKTFGEKTDASAEIIIGIVSKKVSDGKSGYWKLDNGLKKFIWD